MSSLFDSEDTVFDKENIVFDKKDIAIDKKDSIFEKFEHSAGITNFRLGYNPLLDWMFTGNIVKKPDSIRFRRLMTFMYYLTNTVTDYGIHQGFSGYAYIIDAISIFYLFDTYDLTLSYDVYPVIAKKYRHVNARNVEHNIRNAITDAYKRSRSAPGSNKMILFESKPGNRDFLIHLTNVVRMKMAAEFCAEHA